MMETVPIVLGAALLFGLMLLAVPRARGHSIKSIDKALVRRRWDEITTIAAKPDQSARYAIIEADKLLDYVLKNRGYSGETMGERMRSAATDFSYTDDVWEAHKLRNKLVHEAQYELESHLINRSITQFERALKDMGAL
ncbi:MAG: hypothetical protein WD467_03675 [Candidatus Saccharimonadales bacterium]